MINMATITTALQDQIQNHASVDFLHVPVERSEYVNVDPNRTPWCGVYKGKVTFTPRSLGRHAKSFSAQIKLRIVVQAVDFLSAANCEDNLEDYIDKVMNAVWSDPTIDGNVDMVQDFEIEYQYQETNRESTFFQMAIITLTAEVATG